MNTNLTKEQAIQAFTEGKSVYWKSLAYRLIRDEKLSRFLIRCDATKSVDNVAHYTDGFFRRITLSPSTHNQTKPKPNQNQTKPKKQK